MTTTLAAAKERLKTATTVRVLLATPFWIKSLGSSSPQTTSTDFNIMARMKDHVNIHRRNASDLYNHLLVKNHACRFELCGKVNMIWIKALKDDPKKLQATAR
mmetsp:Transcript_8014/g.13884  ORF Transcript_8014/g.13884 Transcript_8014/m.13884 type:complete len:103 (-) Transcript_8014:66-374(-)